MTNKEKKEVKLGKEYHNSKVTLMSIIKDLFMWKTTTSELPDDKKE